MKERPIIFSGPMVRAILDGRKTQTRRSVKPQSAVLTDDMDRDPSVIPCPYGAPGDRLWVRETFVIEEREGRQLSHYRATEPEPHIVPEDATDFDDRTRWKPSIYMPRWASRITLEITGVRVERLQDITELDATREGVGKKLGIHARNDFARLWQSINGPESWDANPWVWVIEFRKLEGGGPMKLPFATIIDVPQGSQEWIDIRKGRLTASNASKILTPTGRLSKQAEAHARRLARETICDDPFEFSGNRATEWGHEHEPAARDAFRDATGLDVIEVGFAIHDRTPCLGCSPDGIIVDDGEPVAGLEIKCPGPDKFVEWAIGPPEVPPEYLPQVHASMIVTGLRRWEFVGYFPGAPLFLAAAKWDDYTDQLADAIGRFVAIYEEMLPIVQRAFGVKKTNQP